MKTNNKPPLAVLNRWKFKGWIVCGTALVSFAAGLLLSARLMHLSQVTAGSDRVFELLVYHTVPGKVPRPRVDFSRRFKATREARSQGHRLLGTQR